MMAAWTEEDFAEHNAMKVRIAELTAENAALLAGIQAFDATNRRLTETAHIALARADGKFVCAARRQSTSGGNDPTDCDWPVCGCDPYADKVIASLQESGAIVAPSGWKLAPITPTDAMIKAAGSEWIPERLWRAMLAAAPSPAGCDAE